MGCVQGKPTSSYSQDAGSIAAKSAKLLFKPYGLDDAPPDGGDQGSKKTTADNANEGIPGDLGANGRRSSSKRPNYKVADFERPDKYMLRSYVNQKIGNLPKHLEGEQVAAGWPPWLSTIAGEALVGWIPRRANSFEKLSKVGQGTYSNVYKARDLETGKIVALKKVKFDNLEPESVRFMLREIKILRRLDHPNIVKLEGLVTSRMSCSLYLVLEYMQHDLAGLAACPEIKFTEPQIKCYLKQLLLGLDHCHRGSVLHRDIKGSNLLIDGDGNLKIADFGLATYFHPDQNHAMTSRVVTLWYRAPELLLGASVYGVGIDLWSAGCILAELFAGKPIMPGKTEVEQLHKIFKLCGSPSEQYWKNSKLPHATMFKSQQPYARCLSETFKDFPTSALQLLETLLAIDPALRGSACQAIQSEFFKTQPLACDPSSLPKYPPTKEYDARQRVEEVRRQAELEAKKVRVPFAVQDYIQDAGKSSQEQPNSRPLVKSKSTNDVTHEATDVQQGRTGSVLSNQGTFLLPVEARGGRKVLLEPPWAGQPLQQPVFFASSPMMLAKIEEDSAAAIVPETINTAKSMALWKHSAQNHLPSQHVPRNVPPSLVPAKDLRSLSVHFLPSHQPLVQTLPAAIKE